MTTAEKVIAIAQDWIGTPYRHQCSKKGIGTDCLGLLRGIYRELYEADDPEEIPNYSPSWEDHRMDDPLVQAAARYMDEIPKKEAKPGDVLVFRMRPRVAAKHCGILVSEDRMVHAYTGHNVMEITLIPWWTKKIVAAFRFRDEL